MQIRLRAEILRLQRRRDPLRGSVRVGSLRSITPASLGAGVRYVDSPRPFSRVGGDEVREMRRQHLIGSSPDFPEFAFAPLIVHQDSSRPPSPSRQSVRHHWLFRLILYISIAKHVCVCVIPSNFCRRTQLGQNFRGYQWLGDPRSQPKRPFLLASPSRILYPVGLPRNRGAPAVFSPGV